MPQELTIQEQTPEQIATERHAIKVRELVELDSIQPEGRLMGWYAKGHHRSDFFIEACLAEFDGPPEGWEGKATVDRVEYEHWRNIPLGPDNEMLSHPSKPGRGAYPVTVVYF